MFTVKGILILDNDGRRILGNYYDIFPTLKEQTAFEKSLFAKTSKANSEVLMLDGLTVLYRSNVDLFFYVLGGPQVMSFLVVCLILATVQNKSYLLVRDPQFKTFCGRIEFRIVVS